MNKLFPIVLALFFFGCSGVSNNGWTNEDEVLNIVMGLTCDERYDSDDILVSRSCTKIDWAKCYQGFFKKEFSAKEFDILMSEESRLIGKSPVKSFEKRSAKVLKLVEEQCGESQTTSLLEEYVNFYKKNIYVLDNIDVFSRIEFPGFTDQDVIGIIWERFFSDYKNYQVRIESYRNSLKFESEVYSELLEVNKKVSELSDEFSKEKPNND